MTVEIPIAAGKRIADEYGYDQVVIVARKVGGPEHVTTYGVDKVHCAVAARMGNFFKHKLMGWPQPAGAAFEVRIAGPDDVIQNADELEALRCANKVNIEYLADRLKNPDNEVLCVATVHPSNGA